MSEEDQQDWQIEEEFLRPVIKSPRECRSIVVKPEDLKFKLFYCHKDKRDLRGTNALEYIKWGETDDEWLDDDGNPNPPYSRPSCRGRRNWYDVGIRKMPSGIIPCSYRNTYFVYRNNGVFIDKRLYELESAHGSIVPSLNTTLYPFFLEMQTRNYGGGGGPIDATVEEIQALLVMKPSELDGCIGEFGTRLLRLANREISTIFDEVEMEDRRELDNIIFDALGLTTGERDAVYEAVIDLVSKRLKRAQTITT